VYSISRSFEARMDWKTFVSTMTGALAWPVVVLAAVYMLRQQLAELLTRLKGASFGNNKLEFAEALQKSREEQEVVAAQNPDAEESASKIDEVTLNLASQFPEAAIMQAYKEVEGVLLEIRRRLDLPPRTNLRSIVRRLVEREAISREVEPLMARFQQARNAAVHAESSARVTPGEALEYIAQAKFLSSLFSKVLARL
jgi:hypothetical protein